MSKAKGGARLSAILATSLFIFAWGASASSPPTTPVALSQPPSPSEIQAARSVWQLLGDERYSYLIRNRDEALALKAADAYLESLDPGHVIFLASDVEKFRAKPLWVLAAMQGRAMAAPFRIHEVYATRARNRIEWLSSWRPRSDYPRGSVWEGDREKAPWPADAKEQNEVWQKSMDHSFLFSKSAPDLQAKLIKEQSERLKRAADLPRRDIVELFVNSFAQTVDPHASYMTPDSAEDLAIALTLSLDGVGMTMGEKDEGAIVESIVPTGPAGRSGQVAVGDVVVAVQPSGTEWKNTAGMPLQEVVRFIRGKAGTKVGLRLAKAGNPMVLKEVVLARENIVITEAGAKEQVIETDGHRVGWIRLPGFYGEWGDGSRKSASASKDVEAALVRLKKANVEGVVLDLRNNGGGSLQEAIKLVGLFSPSSVVVQVVSANEQVEQLSSQDEPAVWDGPLVVLVNKASASASEIAAGALQDQGRALVVGDQTFGKGTVQTVIDLDDLWKNSEPELGQMKMTVAQFFLPSGKSTQLNGVVPDIQINATLEPIEGEAGYKNAAPPATIAAATGWHAPGFGKYLPALRTQTQARSAHSAEFQRFLEYKKEIEARSKRQTAPLNLEESAAQKEKDEAWETAMESELKQMGLLKGERADPVAVLAAEVVADWARISKRR